MQGTGIYYSWVNMKTRTTNKNNPKYKSYGARGITLDPTWKNFNSFLKDMQATWFEGATIERIDVNQGYNPKNCKWIPKNEQYLNKQKTVFRHKGESCTEATKRLGGSKDLVWLRIKRGWSVEDAFTTPHIKNRTKRYIYG